MTPWRSAGGGLSIAAVGLAATLFAGGQDPPTFRVETRAIEVDVFVTDRDGRFVRDLTAADFEILEDDEPQVASAWSPVDLPIEETRERTARGGALDADVVTNTTNGRVYVMLLDSPGLRLSSRANLTRELLFRYTQRAAHRFVDEALGPDDLMAVIHVNERQSASQAFTSNPRLLKAAIDRMTSDMDLQADAGGQPYCNLQKLRDSYRAIEAVSELLGAVTGRRKTLLWMNGRIPYDPVDECEENKEQAPIIAALHRDALRATTRHNVSIYPVDTVGLTNDPPGGEPRRDLPMKRLAALRTIAEDTGGEAIINTNNFSEAYVQVVRANSAYYLLAYQPGRDHRDGRFHTITVRVRRPDVTVRARRGYMAPEPDASAGEARTPDAYAGMLAALRSPIGISALGLRLFVAPFRGTGRDGSVVVSADVRGLGARAGAEPRLEVAFVAIDLQGRPRSAPLLTLPLAASGGAEPLAADTSVQYTDRLVMPPGRHEIRMVVHQPGGATASAVTHVEVPDFTRDPLAMSGLVLTLADAEGRGLNRDARLQTLIGEQPTTRRRFTGRETVTAFAEVYTDARTREQEVRVQATLATAGGTSVRTEPAMRAGSEPDRAAYVARIPLAGLPAGDYVLTLEARTGRRMVNRQIPIAVAE